MLDFMIYDSLESITYSDFTIHESLRGSMTLPRVIAIIDRGDREQSEYASNGIYGVVMNHSIDEN